MPTSPFRADIMKGKVVIISGGGTGIGFGIAQAFGEHGAKIAIMGRRQEKLDEACQKLKQQGIEAIGVSGDVRSYEKCCNAVEATVKAFGRLDVCCCNAAGNFMASVEDLSSNAFKTVIDIDLQGVFHMQKASLPHLIRTQGLVINTSATLHYRATPFQAHASAAKAAIDSLTNTCAVEWAEYGVRVVGIAPGPIAGTVGGPTGRVFGQGGHGLENADSKAKIALTVPLGRWGEVSDIGLTAVFLASDAGSFITATTLVVDGGQWHGSGRSYMALKNQIRKKSLEEKNNFKGGVRAKL